MSLKTTKSGSFKVYSRYDRPPQVSIDTGSDSIVDQSAKKFSDINYIVANYSDIEISSMGHGMNSPIYGDFSKEFTYQDVFDLRDNLDILYDNLPKDKRDTLSYSDFVKTLTLDDDDKIKSLFGMEVKQDGIGAHDRNHDVADVHPSATSPQDSVSPAGTAGPAGTDGPVS